MFVLDQAVLTLALQLAILFAIFGDRRKAQYCANRITSGGHDVQNNKEKEVQRPEARSGRHTMFREGEDSGLHLAAEDDQSRQGAADH